MASLGAHERRVFVQSCGLRYTRENAPQPYHKSDSRTFRTAVLLYWWYDTATLMCVFFRHFLFIAHRTPRSLLELTDWCLARVPDKVNSKQTYSILLQEYAYRSHLHFAPIPKHPWSISINLTRWGYSSFSNKYYINSMTEIVSNNQNQTTKSKNLTKWGYSSFSNQH